MDRIRPSGLQATLKQTVRNPVVQRPPADPDAAGNLRLAHALFQTVPRQDPLLSLEHCASLVEWRRQNIPILLQTRRRPGPQTAARKALAPGPDPCHFGCPHVCNFARPATGRSLASILLAGTAILACEVVEPEAEPELPTAHVRVCWSPGDNVQGDCRGNGYWGSEQAPTRNGAVPFPGTRIRICYFAAFNQCHAREEGHFLTATTDAEG